MDIQQYVLEEIVPLAKERILEELETSKVEINNRPILERHAARSSKIKMRDVALQIAQEQQTKFDDEVKKLYLQQSVADLILNPISQNDESTEGIKEEIENNRRKIEEAMAKRKLAFEATAYIDSYCNL